MPSSKRFSSLPINWHPFSICAPGEKPGYMRSLSTHEGVADRLRFVAFAEKQAMHAFASAAMIFETAPSSVRELWMTLSREEEKHLNLLLDRMAELGVSVAQRPQSLALWLSFDHCKDARQFADFMANAEDRGRQGGEKFHETLLTIDPISAEIFGLIAKEEVEHIALANSIISLL